MASPECGYTERNAQWAMMDYFDSVPGERKGCLAGEQGTMWWLGSTSTVLTEGADVAKRNGVEILARHADGWKGRLAIDPVLGRGPSGRVVYHVRRSRGVEGEIVLLTYFRTMRRECGNTALGMPDKKA